MDINKVNETNQYIHDFGTSYFQNICFVLIETLLVQL